jgi:hypothetical protein
MSKFADQYKRLGIDIPETMDPIAKADAIYLASCIKLGIDPADQPDISRIREKYRPRAIADYKLCIVRDAITDQQEADWDDEEEGKYGGWFWMDSSGFRLFVVRYAYPVTLAGLGSRLCTFSRQDQEFFMQECVALWAAQMGGKLA